MATGDTIRMLLKLETAGAKADVKQFSGELKATGKAADRTGKELREMAKDGKQAGAGLSTAAKAIGGAFAAIGIGRLVQKFASLQQAIQDTRNQLLDASSRTGIAAETLNGLRLAAEGSGLSFENLEGSLGKFPKAMADTAKGTGEARKAFELFGIEVINADGTLRDADTVFRESMAALSTVEDTTTRAALATDLFGKSGTKLLQALGDPAALDQFVELSNKYGTQVGPEAARSSALWQREVANLQNVLRGATQTVFDFGNGGAEAMAVFQIAIVTLSTFIVESVSAWSSTFSSFTGGFKAIVEGDLDTALDRFAKGSFASFVGKMVDAKDKAAAAGQEYADFAEKTRRIAPAADEAARGMVALGGAITKVGESFDSIKIKSAVDALQAQVDAQLQLAVALGGGLQITGGGQTRSLTTISALPALGGGAVFREQQAGAMTFGADSGFDQAMGRVLESFAGALTSGNVAGGLVGALGAAGPVGMGISQGVQGLAAIGQQGAEGIRVQVMGLKDDLIAGLEALPEILTEVLPDFVAALVEELIPALIEAQPRLFSIMLVELPVRMAAAIAQAIARLIGLGGAEGGFGGGGFLGLGGAGDTGGKNRVAGRAGLAFASGGLSEVVLAGGKALGIPGFASGGVANRSTFAFVHAGERIVPTSGTGAQALVSNTRNPDAGMRQGGLTINASGPIVGSMRDLLRATDRAVGPFGTDFSVAINGGNV